jgi:peptidoglycan/LPS O-acetylase OafA/YrhL
MVAVPIIFAVAMLGRIMGLFGNAVACLYSLYALQNPVLSGGVFMLHSALLPFTVGMLMANAQIGPILERQGQYTAIICIVAFLFARFFVDAGQLIAFIAQIFFGGILVGTLARSNEGGLAIILERPFWQSMGRISYSFYLFAAIVGTALTFTVGRFWAPAATDALPVGLVTGFTICLLTMPIATLAQRFVERTGIAAGNRLLSLWSSRNRVTVGAS